MLRTLLLALTLTASCRGQAPLPTFNIDKSIITVSGVSSGAGFATQFHVAYSSEVQGSGTWAGVPYICFGSYAGGCMTTPSLIDVDVLIRETNQLGNNDKIDLLANLANDRVYIHHGTQDNVVQPVAAEKMWKWWTNYIPDASNVLLKNDLPATHCVTSDHIGNPCGIHDPELYLENCNYDSPFHMLNHVLGGGLVPANPPGQFTGRLLEIDQDEFFDKNGEDCSMDSTGFVYIPTACEDGATQCKLHIFFHGCVTQAEIVGTDIITNMGLLEIADTNNIVLLFPQTIGRALIGNPMGCYNWYGYLGDLLFQQYATKNGPQMDGVHNMMKRAAGIF